MGGLEGWQHLPADALQGLVGASTAAAGQMEIYNPMGGVFITRVRGHLTTAIAHEWVKMSAVLWPRAEHYDAFNDWSAMTGYDSESRKILTEWALAHHVQLASVVSCAGDRLVRMGLSVTSAVMALSRMEMSVVDRDEFVAKLRSTMRARGRLA